MAICQPENEIIKLNLELEKKTMNCFGPSFTEFDSGLKM